MANYAFIKNQTVVNVAIFDNPTLELLEQFKNEFYLDEIVLTPHIYVAPSDSYINGKFMPKQIYNSWLFNEEQYCWEPPVPYPVPYLVDESFVPDNLTPDPVNDIVYTWNEETLSWVK